MPELFRITTLGEPRAPWRTSRDEAMQDAIALGLASWDRSKREWFLPVPADIERSGRRDDPAPARSDYRGEPWTPDQIEQLRTLAAKGEGTAMIAVRLHRTPSAIRAKVRELEIRLGRAAAK